MRLRRYTEAGHNYSKAVQLSPDIASGYRGLGAAYFQQREYETAAAAYSKLLELEPDNGSGFEGRGLSLLRTGRYAEALSDLTRALELAPKNRNVSTALARLFVTAPTAMRAPERAISLLDATVLLGHEEREILGAAYYRLGRFDEARNCLLEAVEATDGEAEDGHMTREAGEAILFLAMACCELARHEEAFGWYTKGIAWINDEAGSREVHLQSIRDEAATLLGANAARLVVPQDNGPLDLDPAVRQALFGEGPAEFRVQLYSLDQQVHQTTKLRRQLRLTRDGQPLQQGVDYTAQYESSSPLITIRPNGGVFGNGRYRLFIPQLIEPGNEASIEIAIVVSNQLPTLQNLTFRRGHNGYKSVKCDAQEPITLVAQGAKWRYLDDGSDQGILWRDNDFDDSSWKTGHSQLGYGDGDETTVIGYGNDERNKHPTAYFRRKFDAVDHGRLRLLQLGVVQDDGIAVYLNGEEIVREGVSTDATYDTFATVTLSGTAESTFRNYNISPRFLAKGSNCLAAEIHQSDPSSSDISFDLQLTSPPLALVVFNDLFGDGRRQIPKGSTVTGATLRVLANGNGLNDLQLTRILGADTVDLDNELWIGNREGIVEFDVTQSVQALCDGELNQGWYLLGGNKSVGLDDASQSPELTVSFILPEEEAKLAWHFANCVDLELRDPKLALRYARRAVKASASDAYSQTTLGAALYRNGEMDEAIAALTKAAELDARDLRVLALLVMAHAKCGHADTARDMYRQAVRQAETVDSQGKELMRLCAEAEELLSEASLEEGNSTPD